MLQLTLLGTPYLTLDEKQLPTKLAGRPLALLIYLAVTQRPQGRDLLADLLWSELSNQQARNNLRYALPDLRQVVGDYILPTAHTISFNVQRPYWLDSQILRSTLSQPLAALSTTDLQAALALYQGEFLAGFGVRNAPVFEEWVSQQREELHNLAVHGSYHLAERLLQQGEVSAGLNAVARLLTIEPWHEAGYRLQMKLLTANGQRAAAVAQYERLEKLLDDELGVAPQRQTTALYEQIRADTYTELPSKVTVQKIDANTSGTTLRTPAQSPEATARTAQPNNLPTELPPLIGRTQELEAINQLLLSPEHRLITLLGEGGVGKTRLALALGKEVLAHFNDGVWFVPLVALSPGADLHDRLAVAIAKALRISFSGKNTLLDQLLAWLWNKQILLILDNFDHLTGGDDQTSGAAFLTYLHENSLTAKLLVTSRHLIQIPIERVVRLESLTIPPLEQVHMLSSAQLMSYSSVSLFVERASRANAQFQLNQSNQADVVFICSFVHGLPLAIELAAALTKLYTCREIDQALRRNYTILSSSVRELPEKHRSIKATLDYSWQFLTPAEQRVLSESAIFLGGFSQSAMMAVSGATAEQIKTLLDHSLLHELRAGRFEMHDLVRHYALEQLHLFWHQSAQGMTQAQQILWDRYCHYHAEVLVGEEKRLRREVQSYEVIQEDLDDFRQTWQWALQQNNLPLLERAATGLFRFYELVGYFHEAEAAAAKAVDRIQYLLDQPATPQAGWQALLARLLLEQSSARTNLGQLAAAEALAQEASLLATALADATLHLRLYANLSEIALMRGDNETMRTWAERVLAMAESNAWPLLRAKGLDHLGIYWVARADYQQAEEYFRQALLLTRKIHDQPLEHMLINNLGVVHSKRGAVAQAISYFQQVLESGRKFHDQRAVTFALLNLLELFTNVGDYEQAKQYGQEAQRLYRHSGQRRFEGLALAYQALLAHHLGDQQNASQQCEEALRIAQETSSQTGQAKALFFLGQIYTSQQRFSDAETAYRQAQSIYCNINEAHRALAPQAGLAYVQLLQKDKRSAQATLEELLQLHKQVEVSYEDGAAFVYLYSYYVLSALQERRAAEVLSAGASFITAQASRIGDPTLRRYFLENVVINRTLLELV